ncbi:MAG TPA: hypothetical protein VMI52_03290 [Acetobacteraceae bacterium]|nr:hypothetical protein [Acetobacteraceae bacterium]
MIERSRRFPGFCFAMLLALGLLAGCSSLSSGGGDGSQPSKTYIIVPNGQTAPAPATVQPPAY